jgi:thioredoxin-dependent peroxiredoxin
MGTSVPLFPFTCTIPTARGSLPVGLLFVEGSVFRGTIKGSSSWLQPHSATVASRIRMAISGKPKLDAVTNLRCPGKEIPMNTNDKAPDFTLQDENGNEVSLKSLRGKTVVLYFYPRADTPGCTVEACAFRDTYKQIQKTGVVLLGISPDTPKAQKKFQDKFQLPFSLLADPDKKVAEQFGVVQEKNMYGKKVMGIARTTFVIGPDGKIQHIFPKVKPEGHAAEVLAHLKESAKGAA